MASILCLGTMTIFLSSKDFYRATKLERHSVCCEFPFVDLDVPDPRINQGLDVIFKVAIISGGIIHRPVKEAIFEVLSLPPFHLALSPMLGERLFRLAHPLKNTSLET